MNLNNLKPAWRQFVCFNSMQAIDEKEILFIIERGDVLTARRLPGFLMSTMMFVILIICCQGG